MTGEHMEATSSRLAVGYVRVSTAHQADEGVSLDAQRAKLQAWADLNGFVLADVHVDAGISGKRADNRPALQAALDQCCRESAALVVYSLSRLARSTVDTIHIGERLRKHGADLVSVSERIDTTSAAGQMVFQLLGVMAEFERNQLSERITMAMSHKKTLGKRVGRIPFGWMLDTDGDTLIKHPAEQEALVIIRELREHGLSLRAIADELNRRGIRTKLGAAAWKHTSVRSVLNQGKHLTAKAA